MFYTPCPWCNGHINDADSSGVKLGSITHEEAKHNPLISQVDGSYIETVIEKDKPDAS